MELLYNTPVTDHVPMRIKMTKNEKKDDLHEKTDFMAAFGPFRGEVCPELSRRVRGGNGKIIFSYAAPSLIASDESVRADLALSRIKVRNQIQAVLTPEQQAKAKELRKLDSNRRHKWSNKEY